MVTGALSLLWSSNQHFLSKILDILEIGFPLYKSAFNFPKARNWQELAFCAKILRQNLEFASRAKIQNLRADLQPLSSQRDVCELG